MPMPHNQGQPIGSGHQQYQYGQLAFHCHLQLARCELDGMCEPMLWGLLGWGSQGEHSGSLFGGDIPYSTLEAFCWHELKRCDDDAICRFDLSMILDMPIDETNTELPAPRQDEHETTLAELRSMETLNRLIGCVWHSLDIRRELPTVSPTGSLGSGSGSARGSGSGHVRTNEPTDGRTQVWVMYSFVL
jgi:hypothetical protein